MTDGGATGRFGRDDTAVSLTALAGQTARELAALAGLTTTLQDDLSPLALLPSLRPSAIRSLQSLDRVTQVLVDLARVLDRAGRLTHGSNEVPQADLMAVIMMSELRQRFGAAGSGRGTDVAPSGPIPRGRDAAEGEVLWF